MVIVLVSLCLKRRGQWTREPFPLRQVAEEHRLNDHVIFWQVKDILMCFVQVNSFYLSPQMNITVAEWKPGEYNVGDFWVWTTVHVLESSIIPRPWMQDLQAKINVVLCCFWKDETNTVLIILTGTAYIFTYLIQDTSKK